MACGEGRVEFERIFLKSSRIVFTIVHILPIQIKRERVQQILGSLGVAIIPAGKGVRLQLPDKLAGKLPSVQAGGRSSCIHLPAALDRKIPFKRVSDWVKALGIDQRSFNEATRGVERTCNKAKKVEKILLEV